MLPSSLSIAEVGPFRRDTTRWVPEARSIARELRLGGDDVHPYADGVNLVAALGAVHVLKLFPPVHVHQYEAERRALRFLDGKLSFPVPTLVAEGERDGWRYLVLSRVAGRPLEGRWEEMDEEAKLALLEQVGAWMREVHALPLDETTRSIRPPWPALLAEKTAACVARHERLGLPERFVTQIPAWLGRAKKDLASLCASPPVLLTGEYTPFNLMADTDGALSGMIDFGDAMVGPRDYDLLGPITFLCAGVAARVQALLAGYGLCVADREAARRRLMTLLLLHRYSDLGSQVRAPGVLEGASDLEELSRLVFPLAG